jgi:peptidoglycan-associated lipoprotein
MANAAWMKSHPGTSILIEGHCDERGTVEYNLALGQRRAQSTRDFLVAQGIPGGRIALISYGKERPVCNRRAHFLTKPS